MDRIKAITEDTLIPLSILGVIVGGVVWLTVLNEKVEAAAKTLEVVQNNQEEYSKNMHEIRERLIRIEDAVHGPKR